MNIPHHKITTSPNRFTCNASNQMSPRPFNNMICVLQALSSEYKHITHNQQKIIAKASDHSNCVIDVDTVTDVECDKLTKLSTRQIHEIAMDIMLEMKEQDLDINECFKAISMSHKNDLALNEIEWNQLDHDDSTDFGNWNSANSETYLLKKIKKCLFLFYTKSVTGNNFEIMRIYHKKHEQSMRRHFHRGRVLLHVFWMPKHNGFRHLNALDIQRHSNTYTTILNQILHKKIACCVDGHELRQDRYVDFNASYLSFSYKGYNTRKWMGFVLYVIWTPFRKYRFYTYNFTKHICCFCF